jgi:hypothetical protein
MPNEKDKHVVYLYLIDVRTVQVGRPVGVETASTWVVQTRGEDLWLVHLWSGTVVCPSAFSWKSQLTGTEMNLRPQSNNDTCWYIQTC